MRGNRTWAAKDVWGGGGGEAEEWVPRALRKVSSVMCAMMCAKDKIGCHVIQQMLDVAAAEMQACLPLELRGKVPAGLTWPYF